MTNDPKLILIEDVKKGKPKVLRSPKWPVVRNKHVKENPDCVACGSRENIQVHHLKPFHLFPELELEPTNLITLCEIEIKDEDRQNDNHHLTLGHSGNFKNNNKKVLSDINKYRLTKTTLGKLKGYDGRSLKKKVL